MVKRMIIAVTLAALLAVSPVAAQSITAIGDATGLTDSETIDGYQSDNVASGDIEQLDASLTVAEQHDDVGLSGIRLDFDKRYLRLQYNESIERTLRFNVPSEYWYPMTNELESIDSGTVAQLEPTKDGRATAVTVTVDGPTTLVWQVPKEASFVFWGRDKSREIVSNVTGYEPPSLGDDGTWKYVSAEKLTNVSAYPINTDGADMTIQYDTDPAAGSTSWQTVPDCSGSDVAVCSYEKAGEDNRIYLLPKTDSPPQVRYKQGSDASASVFSSLRELRSIPGDILEDIRSLLGGGASA